MEHQTLKPPSNLAVVDLLVGYLTFGGLGWVLGGALAVALNCGWTSGSRFGIWLCVGLYTLLTVRKTWVAMRATPSNPNRSSNGEPKM